MLYADLEHHLAELRGRLRGQGGDQHAPALQRGQAHTAFSLDSRVY